METTNIRHLMSREKSRLPSLSPDISYLLQAVIDDDMRLDVLAGLIEQYAVVGVRLVAMANSPWSAPVEEIVSIEQACVRLGRQIVRTVAIATTVASNFDFSKCPGFDAGRFWLTNLLSADAAQELAPYFGVDPKLARTAALFRQMGLLWLASEAPELVSECLLITKEDSTISLDGLLVDRAALGYLETSAILLRTWNIPEELTASIDPATSDDHPLGRLLRVCAQISAVLSTQEESTYCLDLFANVTSDDIDSNSLELVCRGLAEKSPKIRQLADSMFSSN